MNIRLFSYALLISSLPLSASARKNELALNKGDFISAERISRNGENVLSVKLSKSGKAKLRKWNKESVGQEVHATIGGVNTYFQLKEPITGNGLEMGPYSPQDASTVSSAINNH
ncbi:MAG TPA: hypothetical protein VIH99_01140 [Bdellovibrionota bacterium]|jgi:hypothetical protein